MASGGVKKSVCRDLYFVGERTNTCRTSCYSTIVYSILSCVDFTCIPKHYYVALLSNAN